jgi:hypothetical protein
MTLAEMRELALHAAKRTAPSTFSVESVDAALRDAMNDIAGSVNEFMRNRYDIYDIIIKTADEIVPNQVKDALGLFAEVVTVPQGDRIMFKRGVIGKNRAKKFLTQVGLSGVYETFRLDTETFELSTKAVGGAATIDFERFLDGSENMADLMDILTEGLTDAVFGEVQRALIAAKDAVGRPAANLVIENVFDGDKMFKLVSTVRAYGGNAAIFATPEFIGAMGPDAIVPPIVGVAQGVYHPDDIDAIHRTGYIKMFRGTPVVEIPQSYTDESNTTTWINPQYAYVLPTGKEKVVKVGLEGPTQIHDFTNRDNSMEIHCYRKMGAAILTHYNWGIYQNEGLDDTSYNPYGFAE